MPYHFQIKQAKSVLLSLFHLYSGAANLASPQDRRVPEKLQVLSKHPKLNSFSQNKPYCRARYLLIEFGSYLNQPHLVMLQPSKGDIHFLTKGKHADLVL